MIEVLFAIGILAVGLIMVAAIFPVAIKWTRQDSDKTIGRIIATNALGIIETEYTPSTLYSVSGTIQPLPFFIPAGQTYYLPSLVDRTYAFGTPIPYPDTATTTNSLYFWTALIRQSPGQPLAGTSSASQPPPTYDLYILVFKKGDLTNIYTSIPPPALLGTAPSAGGRLATDVTGVPYVVSSTLLDSTFPIGALGIDETTGAVFRKIIVTISGTPTFWRSDLPIPTTAPDFTKQPQSDPVAYVPPADGGTASPLIYVYTTTFTP